jgi:hypothetical protein
MKRRRILRWALVGGLLAIVIGAAVRICFFPFGQATLGVQPVVNVSYPYRATPEWEKQIRAGRERIVPGMTMVQVESVLGTADEVHPLYEPQILDARRIGTTYWYLLEKKSADSDLDARVVRVSFDLEGRVIRVDFWGFAE